MALVCALSGERCIDPVTTRSGNVYERRLITKHIQIQGTEPYTHEPLVLSDLITIQAPVAATVPKPRQKNIASLPGLVQSFQNEWDSLLVESFNLKKQLDTIRQELSHAMYQNDAACRVIARLQRERDQARRELETLRETIGGLHGFNIDKGFPGLDDAIKDAMTARSQELSTDRKSRQQSPSLAKVEDIQKYTDVAAYPTHKASSPGILCLDIHPKNKDIIITGGVDETAVIFDRSTEKKIATLAGHGKEVTSVLAHPTADLFITGSNDSTARVWFKQEDGSAKMYRAEHKIKIHKGSIMQLALHPTNQYFATASLDHSWGFHEIETGRTLLQVMEPDNQPLTCVMFQPDGLILATGTQDNLIRVWDIKSQKNVATFQGHHASITDLRFSENGYYLATVAADNVLKLWDLRGPRNLNSLKLDLDVKRIDYDYSGKYLAVAMGQQVRIFTGKTFDPVGTLHHDGVVTDVKFGPDSKFIATTCMDRNLRFWQ